MMNASMKMWLARLPVLSDRVARHLILGTLTFNLCLALAAGYQLFDERRSNEREVTHMAVNQARLLTAHLEQTLTNIDLALQTIVDSHRTHTPLQIQQRPEALTRIALRYPALGVLLCTDATGLVQHWPPRPASSTISLADRDYFVRLRDATTDILEITPPLVGRTSGNQVVALARRLVDARGKFDGVVVASIPVSQFNLAFESMQRRPGDLFEVRSAQGILIAAASGQVPPPVVARVHAEERTPKYGYVVRTALAPYDHLDRLREQAKSVFLAWLALAVGSLLWTAHALRLHRRHVADGRALRASEARFRSFFDHADLGMAVISNTCQWQLANPALAKLFGHTPTSLSAAAWTDFISDDDWQHFKHLLDPKDGCPPKVEKREVRLHQGERGFFDGQVSVSAFSSDQSSDRFLAICVEDISERKARQRQAVHALAIAQAFIEHFPGAASLKDSQLRTVLSNRASSAPLRVDPLERIDKLGAEDLSDEPNARMAANDFRILQSGRSEVVETTCGTRWYETHKFRVQGPDGQAMLASVALDVTPQRLEAVRLRALIELGNLGERLNEQEFVARGLELAERLTDSHIGFLHYVSDDQQTIELVARTRPKLATSTATRDQHYPVNRAGIWADALRLREAVVVNDYPPYATPSGLPPGHAPLQRMLCIPAIENGKVRMLLGVGNRNADYGDFERDTLQSIGNDIWRRIARHRTDALLQQRIQELDDLNQKLAAAQGQLIQSEKMASIGQLAAGVAHELNNPIAFVQSNLGTLADYARDLLSLIELDTRVAREHLAPPQWELLQQARDDRDIDFIGKDVVQLLTESREGADRVRAIVQNLKDFAHVSDGQRIWADLHKGLDSTLNIVWHTLKHKVEVDKQYGDIPDVLCIPGQINQVFMNLLVNAEQAIEKHGQITIRTGTTESEVWVEIADTGKGIAPEHLGRIFDPFFTTKPVGKGTGMGLSLVYGIVTRHGGRITVCSEVGSGSCFRLTLPRSKQSGDLESGVEPTLDPGVGAPVA